MHVLPLVHDHDELVFVDDDLELTLNLTFREWWWRWWWRQWRRRLGVRIAEAAWRLAAAALASQWWRFGIDPLVDPQLVVELVLV